MNRALLYILGVLALVGCSDIDDNIADIPEDAVEMYGVLPIMTRAVNGAVDVADLTDYVGRSEFADKDVAVFTSIKRTTLPINQFTYKNLEFKCQVETKGGVTSTGWSRVPEKGTSIAGGDAHPDRIYWTDATNAHTFIGYCAPQQRGGQTFDWVMKAIDALDTYYGSLGDPTMNATTDIIDYTSEFSGEIETLSGNVKLCEDDILLTYADTIVAEDAIAKLKFHHGLAQVRVIVNISDFAAGGGVDTMSVVSNMMLKDMLTRYKWNQQGVSVSALSEIDNTNLGITDYDQKKDIKLWIPKPKGVGEKSSKTFTFYGLAVPTQYSGENKLDFSFTVTYPNPMNPAVMQDKTYQASIGGLHFDSGECTTISISLNHRNEKMTVGAEYVDWDYQDTPDQGHLKKNSTFLTTTTRVADTEGKYNITIVGDPNATADDATWLYEKEGAVVDVYGNDGTAEHPYVISTANQLLSFAYEVKQGNNGAGRTFQGQHIQLDADIHLQSSTTVSWIVANKNLVNPDGTRPDPPAYLNWMGIGDADHAFNGNFIGGGRNITHLNGSAFFKNIGGQATVSELNLGNVIKVIDHGALAEANAGFIYACRVEGDVDNSTSDYVGSLCGTNSGFIFACIHNGAVKGTKAGAKVGGLLGRNEGVLAVSYHTGAILGTYTYGVEERGYTGSNIYACYFNSTLATPNNTVDPDNVKGRTLGQMQSRSFADTDLNAKIKAIIDNTDGIQDNLLGKVLPAQKDVFLFVIGQYEFVFTPGAYPRVEKKVSSK